MQFDDFLREVGEFGRYQKIVHVFICCIPAIITQAVMILNVVILATPDHRSVYYHFIILIVTFTKDYTIFILIKNTGRHISFYSMFSINCIEIC